MKLIDAHAHPIFGDQHKIKEHEMVFAAGTHEDNWLELIQLRSEIPELRIGFGIHPWFTNKTLSNNERLDELEKQLIDHPDSFLGEMGLDKGPKWESTYKDQLTLFHSQIQLATEYKRSIVLHVVKAHHETIDALKSFKGNAYLHGFIGSPELARCYQNVYFGVNQFTLRSSKTQKAIAVMPKSSILVESDNRPNLEKLADTVKQIAFIKNWSIAETENTLLKNARSWLEINQ